MLNDGLDWSGVDYCNVSDVSKWWNAIFLQICFIQQMLILHVLFL